MFSKLLIKSGLYMTGALTVGSVLFYIVTPSSSANSEYQKQLEKDRGILNKDMMESRRNTQQLITRLQQISGADATKK